MVRTILIITQFWWEDQKMNIYNKGDYHEKISNSLPSNINAVDISRVQEGIE